MSQNEITTPKGGQKIVLKEFITGRDMRELKDIYLKVGKVDAAGLGITDINPAKVNEAEDKSIELVIISIDGKTDDILNTVLKMRAEDYTFVLEKVNEVAGFSKKNSDE